MARAVMRDALVVMLAVAGAGCQGRARSGQPPHDELSTARQAGASPGRPAEQPGQRPRTASLADRPRAARPADRPRYLKGSTHVHTVRSGDSRTAIADVVRWYAEHDYDFIVLTDHNRVSHHERAPGQDLLVIPGIELTHNPRRCVPPPPAPGDRCRIHVNTLFVSLEAERASAARERRAPGDRIRWRERRSRRRVDMYERAFDRSRALGGLIQINHPRWYRGVDGPLLTELGRRGVLLFEVANQGFIRWNDGFQGSASSEDIWDDALTAGVVMWGVASDDAHHYFDPVRPADEPRRIFPAGTGFVMVRAARDPVAIRAALEGGAFYGSSGVMLSDVSHTDDALTIEIATAGAHEVTFIGTGGRVLDVQRRRGGDRATIARPSRGYVRAVVRDERGRTAWTQPVFARERGRRAHDRGVTSSATVRNR